MNYAALPKRLTQHRYASLGTYLLSSGFWLNLIIAYWRPALIPEAKPGFKPVSGLESNTIRVASPCCILEATLRHST